MNEISISIKKTFQSFYKNDLFLFIVLIGLLPVIADYSLFLLLGGSILDLFDSNSFSDIQSIIYYLPLVLLPIGVIMSFFKKQAIGLVGLIPSLFPIAIYFSLPYLQEIDESSITTIESLYDILPKISFIYFIFNGHIRSKAFGVFLFLLLLLLGWQVMVLFFFFTAFFRFLYLAVVQNVFIFSKLGLAKTLRLGLKTLLYWSPMLIFIIPGEIVSDRLYKKSLDGLYDNTFVVSTNVEKKYNRDQFEKDLQVSLDREIEIIRKKTINQTRTIFVRADQEKKAFPQTADNAFEASIPTDLPDISETFALENCPIWRIKCTVKDIIKEGLNDAYLDSRAEQKRAYMTEVNELQKKGGDINQLSKKTIEHIHLRTDNLKTALYHSLMLLFKSILFFSIISNLILGFLIFKSFLYVFARVAFTADNDAYVTLLEEDKTMPLGILKKCGHTYTIPSSQEEDYFISRIYEPSGRAPKFSIPQWTKAILGRLRTRAYAMNKLVLKGRKGDVDFRAMGGKEFVEWEIKAGEVIIFDFKRFVGMSEGIQLTSIVSLRLTSLLMGKIIFTAAKGPGKLILMTEGEPIVGAEEKASASIATSRIVAWQKNTRFHVESELNVMDVFLSGIYLKRQGTDPVLIDADVKGRAQKGIVSFIRKFLLPF